MDREGSRTAGAWGAATAGSGHSGMEDDYPCSTHVSFHVNASGALNALPEAPS